MAGTNKPLDSVDLGDQKNPCLDLLFWAVSKSLAPRMEHKRFQPRPTEDQRRIRIDFKVELLYRLYIPSRAIFVAIVSWRRLSALSTSSLPNSLPLRRAVGSREPTDQLFGVQRHPGTAGTGAMHPCIDCWRGRVPWLGEIGWGQWQPLE